MRVVLKALVPSLILSSFLLAPLAAQQAGRIESMKLLTPDVGWAATSKTLFWTTDNGAHWADVTPKPKHKRQMVSSVFFLNASTGWVLLHCGDDRDILVDEGCWELAATSDAGESWSVTHEKIAVPFSREHLEESTGFSGKSWLSFPDPQHGWEILDIATNSANPSAGEMLRTVDGGKTWVPVRDIPTSDHFLFTTATDGWIAGGKDQELFVTHDAGDSWQKVSLPKPSGVGPDLGINIDPPVFESERHGFLPVRYAVGPLLGPDLSTVVLFATDDGGRSWKYDRTLARVPDISCSDVVGHTLIAVHSQLRKEPAEAQGGAPRLELSLYVLGSGQNVFSNSVGVFSYGAPVQLSFVSRDEGWANLLDRLLATRDGGKTWLKVTPGGSRPSPSKGISAPAKAVPMQMGRGTRASDPARQPASGSSVSTHLGFDAYNVPILSKMTAWWTSSPYYDIAIYLQGSKNGHSDPILGSPNGPAWISAVEGQGWGQIPAWVGVQSPCACYKTNPTTGACTQAYPSVFSSNPGQDGKNEADSAISSANALSLTTSIIYKDIENYYGPTLCTPTQQASAGAAVKSFVAGWDSELHLKGYLAGVYGNPKPAQNDFSHAATIPDDVWVTKTPAFGKAPSATIWNLTPLTDLSWPNNQRLHQFLMNQQNVTFGAVALSIDEDIDNATIANANAIAKSYTYSAANIDCPGAIDTVPIGINDMNSSGVFINGPNQTGTVVGVYQLTIGTPYYGFQYTGGVCTDISVSGAVYVEATGINNQGQIVGYFEDSSDGWHGFQLNPAGSPTQIDFPGATQTYLRGINDAGQIVGWAWNPSTFGYQTFMYYGTKFYDLGVSGGGTFDYMQGFGINGQATLTGIWYYEPSTSDFELTAVPYSSGWTGSYYSLTPGGVANTDAEGIDANGELAGIYHSSSCGDTVSECGFVWTGGPTLLVLTHGSDASAIYGINDFAQAVGPYTDSTTGYSNGLVWTHQ